MSSKKIKWLIYTVLVGLLPIFSRLLVWLVTQPGVISPFVAADFIAFGLILHISTINEIERISDQRRSWKTMQNGTSIMFITLYIVLFTLLLISEGIPLFINVAFLNTSAMLLALISFAVSFSVFNRISTFRLGESYEHY